ncbi:MAG TPA: ROK family protein [Polyangia bacterium]|jgi:polyphosphate glucokinase|nr:ROK family protein [Polyangia bacterium]
MKVLVIDVGGTNIKISTGGRKEPIKIPSGPAMTAAQMAKAVKKATAGWSYDAVSIGFPGPVANQRPATEPHNLGPGWVRFDYQKAFGKPVRVVNDAAMQALGSYQGGRMLFLGLGTGLGSAFVADGQLEPLELAHLPYRNNGTYEDYVGLRGYRRLGRKKWRRHVTKVVKLLQQGLQADYVVLGGGNSKKLKRLPFEARLGDNANAILGGIRLWNAAPKGRRWSVSTARQKAPPGRTGNGRPPRRLSGSPSG